MYNLFAHKQGFKCNKTAAAEKAEGWEKKKKKKGYINSSNSFMLYEHQCALLAHQI